MEIKPIAFYLPQFHDIPENDEWWGKGFTEWTNVRKAKPLFEGHYQPHIPSDLGYYDLRNEDIRIRQADLAQAHGIYGFCYWHYWFGDGKRLLEEPANDFLESGKPDFPICFAWANQTWSGIWHGEPNRILIEQKYLGEEDDRNHFLEMLPYFKDSRYIRVDDKPLFLFSRPFDHPYLDVFIEKWNKWAKDEGMDGIFFLGISHQEENPFVNLNGLGFLDKFLTKGKFNLFEKIVKKTTKSYPQEIKSRVLNGCNVMSYKKMVDRTYNKKMLPYNFPTLFTGWDNTPRSGRMGVVQPDFDIELFSVHLNKMLDSMNDTNQGIFFIKSWNEWAEGNYLEPDTRFGKKKLEIIKNTVMKRENIFK
jgi:hypothetical protein